MTDTAIRPKNVSVSLWEQRLLAIVEPPPADIPSIVEKRAQRTAAHAGAADVSDVMGYNIRPEQIALAAQECGRFGIEEATIVAALGLAIDPKPIYARQAIERLSTQLLDLVTAREDARNAGKVGPIRKEKHIADACTGFLVAAMIEVCATASVAPPPALAAIVRVHFGADNYAAAQMRADQGAYQRAMIFKIAYPEASQSKIARFARVARTLVSEWNKDGALDRAAASHAKRLERETGLEARIAAYLIVKSQD